MRCPKACTRVKRNLPAEKINQGWSVDFLSDVLLSDEQKVRVLNVMDECSRKELLYFAATNIKARKLTKLLKELIIQKGKPAYFRCDNGPEFISHTVEKFAEENGIEIRFSQRQRPTVRKTDPKWIGRTFKRYTKGRVFEREIFQNGARGATRLGHMVECL